jgi:hypothetical protein
MERDEVLSAAARGDAVQKKAPRAGKLDRGAKIEPRGEN